MLSYVKGCVENGYTISFEPNLPKLHVLVKIHFDIFDIFGSAGRAEPFKFTDVFAGVFTDVFTGVFTDVFTDVFTEVFTKKIVVGRRRRSSSVRR